MVVLDNFWKNIGDWFINLFKDIGHFFIDKEEGQLSNLEKIFIVIGIIVVAWLFLKLLLLFFRKIFGIKRKGPQIDVSAKTFAIEFIKIFYWITIAILVNHILGINLSSLAGIASAITVALGLALQDIIGMFASGLLLLRTKNFVTGDFISISNSYGTLEVNVHRVSLLYTLLTTPAGQEVVVPNNNVTKSNIVNYTKNPDRRMDVRIQVAYDSDIELVKRVLVEILNSDERVNRDPAPTVFIDNFEDYAITFMLRCKIPYQYYWDVLNGVREKILIAFRENNIKMPVRTSISIESNESKSKK